MLKLSSVMEENDTVQRVCQLNPSTTTTVLTHEP